MNAEPAHTVVYVSEEVFALASADEHPYGDVWLVDGVRWLRWTEAMRQHRLQLGHPVSPPAGWYLYEKWVHVTWAATEGQFDPLMSAVVQAIWEAHQDD